MCVCVCVCVSTLPYPFIVDGYLSCFHVLWVSVQSLSRVRLFVTPWTAARQASLSITKSRCLLRVMSIESVMPSKHLILCSPFSSCLQFFPGSGSFQMSQFFTSGAQSIGASTSASVLPMNIVFSLTSPEMMRWSRIDIFIVLWGVLYSTDFRVKSARFESC